MKIFKSKISNNSDDFRKNSQTMLALLSKARQIEVDTQAASDSARERFTAQNRLLPRERLSLLLDRNSDFFELASLAGYKFKKPGKLGKEIAGGGLIAGIGVVSGVRCMISVSDSGIEAGAFQPMGLEKLLRIQEIALENKLPFIQLVDSGGGNLLEYKVENFVHGGAKYRNLARLSAAGIPVITIAHGSATAGGAYQVGLSDYVVMVKEQTKAFLAGPALLKAATGEQSTSEELGGGLMHSRISGLGDYLANDDASAITIVRDLVASLGWEMDAPIYSTESAAPLYSSEDLLGIMPLHARRAVDMREIIARIVDGSELQDFGALYGVDTICCRASINGKAVGIIANNGPIDPSGAGKAAHFIQACNQLNTPIIYFHNTTGFMVGREYEQAGSIKYGSQMIQAVASATVPQITIFCGASFGAGHYAMCGRAFAPRFCFSWPNAEMAVMGAEQAASTMETIARESFSRLNKAVDEERMQAQREKIIQNFERQMDVFATSARLLDDGVIDPRSTRAVLNLVLEICADSERIELRPQSYAVPHP